MVWMVRWLLVALGVAAIAVTVLALVPSNERWIRIWDFPRVQVAACLAVVLLLAPFVAFSRRRLKRTFAALLAAALAWQVVNIWPYTPLAAPQAEAAADCPADSRIDLPDCKRPHRQSGIGPRSLRWSKRSIPTSSCSSRRTCGGTTS